MEIASLHLGDGPGTVADPAARKAQRLGAAWLTSYLEILLFQIQPKDPIAFVGVAAVLTAAALVSMVIPMRRAITVDPAVTLRRD